MILSTQTLLWASAVTVRLLAMLHEDRESKQQLCAEQRHFDGQTSSLSSTAESQGTITILKLKVIGSHLKYRKAKK